MPALLTPLPSFSVHCDPTLKARRYQCSVGELRKENQEHVEAIFTGWRQLGAAIHGWEKNIQSRWMKKNLQKRQDILRRAWLAVDKNQHPIPSFHRPDFNYVQRMLRITSDEVLEAFWENENALYWPNLNLDDLSSTPALLSLLHVRGRNPPSIFAVDDLHSVSIGLRCQEIPIPDLEGHAMYIAHETSQEKYGRLVSWEDDPLMRERYEHGSEISAAAGSLVLYIQSRLYPFLFSVRCKILGDMTVQQVLAPPLPPVSHQAPSGSTKHSVRPSLLRDSAYALPMQFNLDQILGLLDARWSAAECLVWELREDPEAFANHLLERGDHDARRLRDQNNQRHPHLDDDKEFWQVVVTFALLEAH